MSRAFPRKASLSLLLLVLLLVVTACAEAHPSPHRHTRSHCGPDPDARGHPCPDPDARGHCRSPCCNCAPFHPSGSTRLRRARHRQEDGTMPHPPGMGLHCQGE